MAAYESELSGFLRELHQQRPTLASEQRAARDTWWERHSDDDLLARWAKARVRPPAYPYYPFAGVVGGKGKVGTD